MIKKLPPPTQPWLVFSFIALTLIASFARLVIEIQDLNQKISSLEKDTNHQTTRVKDFHALNLEYFKVASLSATRKSQGVNVATVESDLKIVQEQILENNFASASASLIDINGALDSLLHAKVTADRIAADSAKKKAEEAKKAAAVIKVTPVPTQTTPDPNSLGFGYSRTTINTKNGSFTINLIKVNLSVNKVVIDAAIDGDCANACATMPLSDYVSRNSALYGMNGTYFCPPDYPSCAGKVSSFDFPIYVNRLGRWLNQGNLYWTNRAMMTFSAGSATFYPAANAAPTGGFAAAIVSSPGLVHNSADIVSQYSLTSAQTTKGSRGGIGVKGNTLFMVIASGASVSDLAMIFQSLGADHALNIDGGRFLGDVGRWLPRRARTFITQCDINSVTFIRRPVWLRCHSFQYGIYRRNNRPCQK